MKPIKLTLKGFAGIASGQGKNEVVVDLESLVPSDAVTVALYGPNGAGKTTVMDNLHPYRLMPSHASKPTPGSFSIYEHIVDGEGSKELIWEHLGIRYMSTLRFRATAKTKKTEAYLFVVAADGSTSPWKDPKTGAESDGKTDTYDKAIETILGKPEVFFNAQFSAQGRAPIGSMSATEVKQLIAEMIGASKSAELSTKANDVVKLLKPRQAMKQEELAKLKAGMFNEEVLSARMVQDTADLEGCRKAQEGSKEAITGLLARIAALKGSQEQRQAVLLQHQALDREVEAFESDCKSARDAMATEKSGAESQTRKALVDAEQRKLTSTNLVSSLADEVSRLQALVDTEVKVSEAKADLANFLAQVKLHQQVVDEATPKVLALEEVQHSIASISAKLATAKNDGEHLAEALAQAQQTAALLLEVPCQGTDMSGMCKLLAQSNEAAGKVPAITIRLDDARKSYGELRGQGRAMQERLQSLRDAKEKSEAAKTAISNLNVRITKAQAVADTERLVNEARSTLAGAKVRLQEALNDQAQAFQAHNDLKSQLQEVDATFAAKRDELEKALTAKRERLQAMRNALPHLGNAEDESELARQLETAQNTLKKLESEAVLLQQSIATTVANLEVLTKQREQVALVEREIEAVASEISKWVLLAKALGTNGIIAMSIDDAGPDISRIANELLEDCYGGRFSLSLLTQQQTQAGITKEDFIVQVEDNHRGETKTLERTSGGEKVWINECLVRAIALFMAQVADTRSQTLFSDESDGALDPKRKREFMAMKRAVIERGGYEREYLITHTPELLEMCDAVIDVTKL
ncbi:hypothetical protein [Hydrogenophaga sp. NFH-34]|uniref:hypothetical protein n=1 Tax=Hydrogenophaga sp. NFH-34 TaxID=2744446 RepID=UPI001F3674CA|nr:hypothetical protein [Hydrogenophaga sp. NFH-34]